MEDKPLVSVIIPLYNAAPYISDCLESVLSQTWPNKEIIVVDDGSTDNSAEIAKGFAATGVKLIVQPNSGASIARNVGLAHAKGAYIQFMDADDLLSDEKIASEMEVLAGSREHLALCPTAYFNDGEDPSAADPSHEWFDEGSDDPVDFLARLYGGYDGKYGGMIQPNAWLTPKLLIDRAGLWNPMRNPDDDGEFFCRVVLASKGIRFTAKGVNFYRKFDKKESWSNRKSHVSQAAVLESWMLKARRLEPYRQAPEIQKALAFNFTELCYSNYPDYPDLSARARDMAIQYGGLAHPPYFGNKLFNKLRAVLPWKTLLKVQRYYHALKAN
jgi:glycosyltransferase involved in cell wall biosynthesis